MGGGPSKTQSVKIAEALDEETLEHKPKKIFKFEEDPILQTMEGSTRVESM